MVARTRAAALCLLIVACGDPSPPAGLYVIGNLDIGCRLDSDPGPSIPTVWVNGDAMVLSDCENWNIDASGVAVTDDDVLVAGTADNRAVYWNDGWLEFLTELRSAASSIVVSEGDVYIAGNERHEGSPSRAAYWKNGERHVLSTGGDRGTAIDIAVAGGDVYVLGNDDERLADDDAGYPTFRPRKGYWVNDTRVNLYEAVEGNDDNVQLESIAVAGQDVFVVGEQVLFADHTATIWTNGEPSVLEEGVYAHAVAVDGADVYVAGQTSTGAALWRNGTLVPLAGDCARALDVTIVDGDVYVVGSQCVWKNGELLADEAPGISSARAVFVKP